MDNILTPEPATQKISKDRTRLSFRTLILFAIIFAGIGGYSLYKSFASPVIAFKIWDTKVDFDQSSVNTFNVTTTGEGTAKLIRGEAQVIEYDVPDVYKINSENNLNLAGLVVGADNNLWFGAADDGVIGKADTNGKVLAQYKLPGNGVHNITKGPDGNIWYAGGNTGAVGKITTSGQITEYKVPTAKSTPRGITTGADGNLWFTDADTNTIGRVNTRGEFAIYNVPTGNASPWYITKGPDGNVWFTERQANKIGKITTSGQITEYNVPTAGGRPSGIVAGPDGNIWFTEVDGNRIGKLAPSTGQITEYPIRQPIPSADARQSTRTRHITVGPDNNLWFTENGINGNKVGRITINGMVTEYDLPKADRSPYDIITGPDGNLWFVENGPNNLVKFIPPNVRSGSITLQFDAGNAVKFTRIENFDHKPQDTDINYEFQTSCDGKSWSGFNKLGQVPAGRYIQVKANLSSDSGQHPYVDKLVLHYTFDRATRCADQLPSTSEYEGKLIYGSDRRQYFVKDGKKQPVTNPMVSFCIVVRRGAGQPKQVDNLEIANLANAGRDAWCNYDQEADLNFVREDKTPTVWLVLPSGNKLHVGKLCANLNNLKKYRVHVVPNGETSGHNPVGAWFGNSSECSEVPLGKGR